MPVRCLSIHARYRCRHSGACCSGVFAIPAEAHVVEMASACGLQPPAASAPLFVRRSDREHAQFLGARPDGACVFFEAENGRTCAIHRYAGADALPTACRHFPRVFLQDGRGLFLSLSHFCPTAAWMLLDDVPLAIVGAEAPLTLEEPIEAFDALGALPPLLRPGLLMDLTAYDVWERASIATFARSDLTHEQALAVVAAVTETVRMWEPGRRSLASLIEDTFASTRVSPLPRDDHDRDPHRLSLIGAAYPAGPTPPPDWWAFDRPIKHYLAAKLFANRIAYESRGLRSIVEWLRVCLALLRCEAGRLSANAAVALDPDGFVEAIRAADLVLVHRIDSLALARRIENLELRT